MICEICNQFVWIKYKSYNVHKNRIVPLQVKAQLKGENSDISFIIRNRNKEISQQAKKSNNNLVIIDDLEFKAEYYNEEAWKHEDKQRYGEYFNSVKTIRG